MANRSRLLHGKTVLVADDEALVQRSVARLLRGEGAAVVFASSGQEAIRAAGHHGVDAVVMDVRMPGMTGLEAAALIKASRDVPIVVWSGDDVRERAHALGCEFVHKADVQNLCAVLAGLF